MGGIDADIQMKIKLDGMLELDLGFHRKARIWQEQLPNACFDSPTVFSEDIEARQTGDQSTVDRTSFCIEYRAHLGGRTVYGLLGSSYERASTRTLSIRVFGKESGWEILVTDLYGSTDPVNVGLPFIFARSVQTAASEFFSVTSYKPVPGNLTFNCAAYSDVGSSQHIFMQLAIINCAYFFPGANFGDEDGLQKLLAIINDQR